MWRPQNPGALLEGVQIGVALKEFWRAQRGRRPRGKNLSKPPLSRNIPQRFLRLPVGGRQHEQEHAQVLVDIARAECRGLLEDESALARTTDRVAGGRGDRGP